MWPWCMAHGRLDCRPKPRAAYAHHRCELSRSRRAPTRRPPPASPDTSRAIPCGSASDRVSVARPTGERGMVSRSASSSMRSGPDQASLVRDPFLGASRLQLRLSRVLLFPCSSRLPAPRETSHTRQLSVLARAALLVRPGTSTGQSAPRGIPRHAPIATNNSASAKATAADHTVPGQAVQVLFPSQDPNACSTDARRVRSAFGTGFAALATTTRLQGAGAPATDRRSGPRRRRPRPTGLGAGVSSAPGPGASSWQRPSSHGSRRQPPRDRTRG